MNKITKKLFVLLATTILSSCVDIKTPHEHSFSEEWESDETNHWHNATCEHSELTQGLENHIFGEDNVCDVCGYKKIQVESFVVTFNTNGGNHIDPIAVVEGGTFTQPQDPTKDNFVFLGWYETEEYTGNPYVFGTKVTSDLTLHALWGISVKFIGYGNEIYQEEKIRIKAKVDRPTDPVASGLHFDNWYSNSEFSGEPFNFDQEISSEMTLYAKFCHKVTFLNSANDVYLTQYLTETEILEEPQEPTKFGHTFDGWYIDSEFSTKYEFGNTLSEDLVLYSKMNPISYKITYVNAEGLVHENPNSYVYGVGLEFKDPTENTEAEINKFYGWYFDEEFTEPAEGISKTSSGDLMVYAKIGTFHNITFKGWPELLNNSNATKFSKYDEVFFTKSDFNQYPGFTSVKFLLNGEEVNGIPLGTDTDIEITMSIEKTVSKVTLNPNGGSIVPHQSYLEIVTPFKYSVRYYLPSNGVVLNIYNDLFDVLETPEGFDFVGLFLDELYEQPLSTTGINELENGTKLYARYYKCTGQDDLRRYFPFKGVFTTEEDINKTKYFTNTRFDVPYFCKELKLTVRSNGSGYHFIRYFETTEDIHDYSITTDNFEYVSDTFELTEKECIIVNYTCSTECEVTMIGEVLSYKDVCIRIAETTDTMTYDINYFDIPTFNIPYLHRYTFKGWYDEDGNKLDTKSPWTFVEGEYTYTAKFLPSGEYEDQLDHYVMLIKSFISIDEGLSKFIEEMYKEIIGNAKEKIYDAECEEDMQIIVDDCKVEMDDLYRNTLIEEYEDKALALIQYHEYKHNEEIVAKLNVAMTSGIEEMKTVAIDFLYNTYLSLLEKLDQISMGV